MHEVFDQPLGAGPSQQVDRVGVGGGQRDGQVRGFTRGPAAAGQGAGPGDPDGLFGVREPDPARGGDGDSLDGPGLSAAVTAVAGLVPYRELCPGQSLELGVQGRPVALDRDQQVRATVCPTCADRYAADAWHGVKLAQVLRGLSRAPKWVPGEDEVLALLDAVPPRYRAAVWLGAGQGCRFGEVLGMEDGDRCIDRQRGELHVIQQLRYAPQEYGGVYLSEPKAGSSGTIDLDPVVGQMVADHVRDFPPVPVEMVDITSGEPVRRAVPLLFTTTHGNAFTDKTWSREWMGWRDAAGWPKEHGGFHALRHFFATTLITNHAEPQEVQRLLRHKTLRITLETYVHWWPKRDRPRGLVGSILSSAADRTEGTATVQDQI